MRFRGITPPMQTPDPTDPWPVPNVSSPQRFVRMLLLFEDLSAGMRAGIALKHLGRAVRRKVALSVLKCSFAGLPKNRVRLADAKEPDIVWLAGHGNRPWPASAFLHLTHWLERRQLSPGVLVLSFDPSTRASPQADSLISKVTELAASHRAALYLDFADTSVGTWTEMLEAAATPISLLPGQMATTRPPRQPTI